MQHDERIKELEELASFDESQPYEVDMGGIYREAGKDGFILITASGCSCWDGDFGEEHFDTFDALKVSLLNEDRYYNPSLETAKEMIAEAEKLLAA